MPETENHLDTRVIGGCMASYEDCGLYEVLNIVERQASRVGKALSKCGHEARLLEAENADEGGRVARR